MRHLRLLLAAEVDAALSEERPRLGRPAGPYDDAAPVELEIRRVEEGDLPELSVEGIDLEGLHGLPAAAHRAP